MKKDLVLVVGGSGTVGSELIRLLRAQDYQVQATTSKKNPPIRGNEDQATQWVTVNLETGDGVKAAFEGVDRAFFLSPPGYADQHAILSPLIQEAKRRGLRKVVLMTAMGANADETSPFRRAEIELEKSGLNYNIVRPNFFLQNFNTFWINGIQSESKILLPAGAAKVSFIDARDVSAVAAKLLTTDEFDRQAFDLTGDEALDHGQVAQAISKVSGRNVQYQEISPERFTEALLKVGLPKDYVSFLVLIFGFLREGYSAKLTSSVRDITGRTPFSLQQYTNDHKRSWIL